MTPGATRGASSRTPIYVGIGGPRRPVGPRRAVEVAIRYDDGEVETFPLQPPVPVRRGRERDPIRVEILGGRAFLTANP
jgi:hypothetical protein